MIAGKRLAAFRIVIILGLVLSVGWLPDVQPRAKANSLDFSIDLTQASGGRHGLVFQSMVNRRWGSVMIGPKEDNPIRKCGCLLTVFAMQMTYFQAESLPWFPVSHPDPWGDGTFEVLEFNPIYMHRYLMDGRPGSAYESGWGYKDIPSSCGTLPKLWALETVANPAEIRDENGNVVAKTPSGFTIDYIDQPGGLDAAGRDRINRNLYNGIPTPIGVKARKSDGTLSSGNHLQLVVGWDADKEEYLILDPAWSTGSLARTPGNGYIVEFDQWQEDVVAILDTQKVYSPNTHIAVNDDPAPIELLSISPDGRRTGYDPVLGQVIREDTSTSYIKLGPWVDTLGEVVDPDSQGKFLDVRNPVDGTYRFVVTGTGDGPFKLDFTTVKDAKETIVQTVEGTISEGQTRKFEMEYAENGTTTLTEVDSFSPNADAGNDVAGVVGTEVDFNGSLSNGVDSDIVSYEWDFGDGQTGTGVQPAHTYASSGIYQVTLTVTDDKGRTGTSTTTAYITGGPGDSSKTTEMLSRSSSDEQANGFSEHPSITPDGRYVAFSSFATNLGSSSGVEQVYVRDRETGETEIVSVTNTGEPSNGDSDYPAISADGRFVAFVSQATNLATGTTDDTTQVYVHDREMNTTELVSVSSDEVLGNNDSTRPSISADGRVVAFQSWASNLVANDTMYQDIFVRDREAGTTERVSISSAGLSGSGDSMNASISADGRYVAFESDAARLVSEYRTLYRQIYVRDRQAGTTERVSIGPWGSPDSGTYPGTHTSARPSISADGRYVAFKSDSTNLVTGTDANGDTGDIYVRDRQTNVTERVNLSSGGVQGNAAAMDPTISANGRYVAFYSAANNLVVDDTNGAGKPLPSGLDIFLRDLTNDTTERVSLSSSGEEALPDVGGFNSTGQQWIGVADDGATAFQSTAYNLVEGDTQSTLDVFVRYQAQEAQAKPIANPSGPYVGWATSSDSPATIQFDGSGSFDQGDAALTATWDFGDGSDPVETAGLVTTHGYIEPGTYTVTLTVNNGSATSDPISTTVEVFPSLPSDTLNVGPSCGEPGSEVAVSGYAQAHNASLLSGGWNLSNGPLNLNPVPLALPWNSGQTVTVTPTLPDLAFQTTVTVPDDIMAGGQTISVENGPSAQFSVGCLQPSNYAPKAHAGGPQYAGTTSTLVTFDGTGSSDADGDALTYHWDFGDGTTGTGPNPQHQYARAGTYDVMLVVNDGKVNSFPGMGTHSFAVVEVTADTSDTVAPVTTAVTSPEPNPTGSHSGDVTVQLTAVDNESGSGVKEISYTLSGAQTGGETVPGGSASVPVTAEGLTTLTFFATDNAGNVEAEQTLEVRIERTPLTATIAISPNSLWPANHKMVTVTVSITATEGASGNIQAKLISVTSNEPDNGLGDGDTANDIQDFEIGTEDMTGKLRAERSGKGNGRVYTLTYEITDEAGNTATVTGTVIVPKSMNAKNDRQER